MDPPVARTGGKRAPRDVTLSIRLTRETLAWIDSQAAKEERTRSDMLRILLRDGIEHRKK
jgi:metal-responsive CopG/Arc/MetJ family transcriptional regulator